MYLTQLFSSHSSEPWLYKVKRFTVTDEFNPRTGKATTTVRIYYRSLVNFRRTRKFVTQQLEDHASVETYVRPPEAQELINYLKMQVGVTESVWEKPWRSHRAMRPQLR